MLSQAFSVIIDRGISEPVHGRELVASLNAVDKKFMFQLMANVEILVAKIYDTQMVMNTWTCTYNVSFTSEFQKHLSNAALKHEVIDQVKYKNG